MSAIVSDASPLINLARVDRFDLLTAFYGRAVIPQAVYDEVVVRGLRHQMMLLLGMIRAGGLTCFPQFGKQHRENTIRVVRSYADFSRSDNTIDCPASSLQIIFAERRNR